MDMIAPGRGAQKALGIGGIIRRGDFVRIRPQMAITRHQIGGRKIVAEVVRNRAGNGFNRSPDRSWQSLLVSASRRHTPTICPNSRPKHR